MPNYIVTGARFDPFSMQELLQPAVMATQAHQEMETQLGELSQKADVWQNLANQERDPETYKKYKAYADDLKAKVDDLAANGLNPTSRQGLIDMKRRYSSEITPIENAYNTRNQQIAAQQELRAKGYLISRDASMTSLDEYMKNPALGYQSYSGKDITNSVLTAAKSLQKEMQDNPDTWRSILGGQYYEKVVRTGFTSEDIMKVIRGDEDADPRLVQLVNTAIDKTGIAGWNNPEALDMARASAYEGLWGAVGTETTQQVANRGYETAAQRQARELAKAQYDDTKERLEKGIPEKAIRLGNNGWLYPIGGNSFITIDNDGNVVRDDGGNIKIQKGTNPSASVPKGSLSDEDAYTLQTRIGTVSSVDEMKSIGFTPIGVVVRHGNGSSAKWQRGKEGKDMKGVYQTPFHTNTRTNLVEGMRGSMPWDRDNFSYNPRGGNIDFVESSLGPDGNPISTLSQIPGYRVTEMGYLDPIEGTPFYEIIETLKEAGVVDIQKALNSVDVQIMRVSGRGSREDDYDYEVFVRDDAGITADTKKKKKK